VKRQAGILLGLGPVFFAPCREARNEVQLGLNLELTGDIRTVGQSSLDGVSLYVRQLKEAGRLDLAGQKYFFGTVARDNGAHPAQAAEIAQQLVTSDGVLAMIGPNSGACAWRWVENATPPWPE
jgi:ABC-type branched-subunit amino acid transport system substrate-binding protein